MNLALVAVAAVFAIPAIAQDQAAPAADGKQAAAPVDKKICRRHRPTGSMFNVRECHTKAEWAAMDDKAAEVLRRTRQDNGRLGDDQNQ